MQTELQLAQTIAERLTEAGLILPRRTSALADGLADGTLTVNDWTLRLEEAQDQAERE
jgi:hypothetical protein